MLSCNKSLFIGYFLLSLKLISNVSFKCLLISFLFLYSFELNSNVFHDTASLSFDVSLLYKFSLILYLYLLILTFTVPSLPLTFTNSAPGLLSVLSIVLKSVLHSSSSVSSLPSTHLFILTIASSISATSSVK